MEEGSKEERFYSMNDLDYQSVKYIPEVSSMTKSLSLLSLNVETQSLCAHHILRYTTPIKVHHSPPT